jgi:predicted HAD superfamily Cof-like phosphohydrolase
MTNNTLFEDIIAFHTKFELTTEMKPHELEDDLALFRIGFMIEEIAEYAQASGYTSIARGLNDLHENIKGKNRWLTRRNEAGHDLEMQFDSLIDLVYVAIGTSYLHGVDFDEGWRRVHKANMAKVRVERITDSKRGSVYDVVKPVGWRPPDLSDLVK